MHVLLTLTGDLKLCDQSHVAIIYIFISLQIKHNTSSQGDIEVNLYCMPKLARKMAMMTCYEVAIKCACEVLYGLK